MGNEEKVDRMESEQEVDSDDHFIFPKVLTEHDVLGKKLIIAPEQANWLVCECGKYGEIEYDEYRAFRLFRDGKSVQEVIDNLCGRGEEDSGASWGPEPLHPDGACEVVSRLIAQILGKNFLADSKVTERPLLKMASLCLTAGCNLCCSTCFMNSTVAGKNECTFEQWARFLRAFRDSGGGLATLTGGEPLLNQDCPRIVQYAKSVGLRVVLLTNGTLLTGEKAKILCENCDQIRISIDGPDAETHDMNRGRGNFEKAVAGLRHLAGYPECELVIAMTPTPDAIPAFRNGLGRFVDWIHRDIRPDIEVRVTGRLMQGRNTPKMSSQEKLAFGQAVHAFCNDQMGEGSVEKMDAANILPNQRNVSCGMAANIIVFADGGIGICNYSTETVANIKDIQEGDGKHFISQANERLRQIVLSTRVERFQPCADCDLRYFCGGKCRMEYKSGVCQCEQPFRDEWYGSLVRISPYLVKPLTDGTERR